MAEIDELLGTFLGGGSAADGEKGMEGDIFEILLKVMPLVDTVNKETDDERLLKALMPYMSAVRREKLDTAQSILKIAKIMPLLGEVIGKGEGE